MTITMLSYSGIKKESPELSEIYDIISNTTEWESIELTKRNDNGLFKSQLIIIVEPDEGVLLRFCGESGDDEFIFIASQNHESKREVETFDGGDEWIVPSNYFNNWNEAKPIIEGFLLDGSMHQPSNWNVVGA